MSKKNPWWQENFSSIIKAMSFLTFVIGVLWGGGAWMASQDAQAQTANKTLEKIESRVDDVNTRMTKTEEQIRSLSRESERMYRSAEKLDTAVTELKIITHELQAVVLDKDTR